VIEREYGKLEPYLNVFSGKAGATGLDISEDEVEVLKVLLQKFREGKVKIENWI